MVKEQCFYVKTDSDLIGVNVNDINKLALFSLSLEKDPGVRDYNSYMVSLENFYSNNENELKDCYYSITSSESCKKFLANNINIILLERDMKRNGFKDEFIDAYKTCIQNYQKDISYSQNFLDDRDSQKAR